MSKTYKPLIFLAAILLVVSLACGSSSPNTPSSSSGGQEQTEVSAPVDSGNSSASGTTTETITEPEPTSTPEPTNTPEPTATPTPAPIGMSRSNPAPSSEVVSAPSWDVQVLEVKRGEAAWADIQAANMFNEPAPEGMEYLLVKLHVKSTYEDSEEHSIGGCDFDVTGDRLMLYTCSMADVVEPEPQLDARLYSNGEAEGWAGYLVGQGEGNLLLVVNETFNFDDDRIRYIALDEGAAISVSPELAGIQPTDLGKDRSNPAPMSEPITIEDWEISVLEVIRGEEAAQMVLEANQFNEPPAEGLEYIAVRVHANNISTADEYEYIDRSFFNTTGDEGVSYDLPSVVDPEPALDFSLYPGGEAEGWIVVQAAVGETGVKLVVEPLWDFGGNNQRFILLEP